MIEKDEVIQFYKKYKLDMNMIEKDYVLSWILYGIAHSTTLNQQWIFKGGTCLKKCYFEEYRFSEDLDFTVTDKNHISSHFLTDEFKKISKWIYKESGIEIPEESLSFEEYLNPRGTISVEGKIAYKGPNRRRGNHSRIKLDLTNDELLVNQPEIRKIYHPYSDMKEIAIQTYSIEEIFAEKLRALAERLRPRDLYDVIHLFNDKRWSPDQKRVKSTLEKKCEYKKMPVSTIELLESSGKKQDLIADWNRMLVHQISDLEPYEYYWEQLPKVFKWLDN